MKRKFQVRFLEGSPPAMGAGYSALLVTHLRAVIRVRLLGGADHFRLENVAGAGKAMAHTAQRGRTEIAEAKLKKS